MKKKPKQSSDAARPLGPSGDPLRVQRGNSPPPDEPYKDEARRTIEHINRVFNRTPEVK